jgi:phosphatidylglycerol:prolipoprotein diacylglycerol transferase
VGFYRWRKKPFLPHADAIMFGFPFGWMFGRTGCFLAHDHIGRRTDFPLAVNYPPGFFFRGDPGGPRFDLGLNEVVWTALIAVVFWVLGRRARPPGFFVMLWCLLYAPARFVFDFLRNTDLANADVRWGGLTPAQWGCFVMFGIGLALLPRMRRSRDTQAEALPGDPVGST